MTNEFGNVFDWLIIDRGVVCSRQLPYIRYWYVINAADETGI